LLEQMATPEGLIAAFQEISRREISMAQQSQLATEFHINQMAAQAPEFFRVHGARIRHAASLLPEPMRGTPQGAIAAAVRVVAEEAMTTGDLPGTLRRVLGLLENSAPAQAPAKRTLAPQERVPAPSTAMTGATRERAANASGANARVRYLMEAMGMSRAEAEAAARY
jgi:hypothetical protein